MDNNEKTKSQNYFYGAAILTAGVIIMKILGALYKIPVANIIGDDGYSMFISTYNVYNVFLTLSTAGLPVALSRLISEADAEGRPMQARATFRVAMKTFVVVGIFCSLIMLLFPGLIAGRILHNPDAAASIRVMAPSVLLVCLVSGYRGYCQGYGNMIPTTIGQVLEVLAKVIIGLVLAAIIMRSGGSKSAGSAGAIFGVTAGSAVALVFMVIYKRIYYKDSPLEDADIPDSDGRILRRFLRIGIPIALGASALSIINLVDSGICMARLQSGAGFALRDAQKLYGVYGEAQTLYNLPAAFITPLTISVVPAIAAANVRGENDKATKISEDSMRIAAAVCLPMGIGLAVLSTPIMRVIYRGSHGSGPVLLAILGVTSFFVCMVLMENAILQASGREKYTMITLITGGLIKISVNWFLVADPRINIYGAALGSLISYVVMAVMNYVFMCYALDKNPKVFNILKGPVIASAAMGVLAWLAYFLVSRLEGEMSWTRYLIAMIPAMVIGVIAYLVAAVKLKAITAEDMDLIPKGKKISKLLHLR
ncbi:MAG: polysaccharide biosynthesis protein [Oscillospiraceae bacterium]|nr:polysaccharide biosynthesis protein [Oscillospiraceae bacterium]